MREQLWSGLGLFGPLKARASGALASGVGGVSIDTRTLEPGDLFFAIKGDASDGHDYVRAAFEKGAAAAVIDEAHADALAGSGPLYVVRDTLAAMRGLGAAARERSHARIIAVTGSAGKTSTKEALRTVLSKFGATHASAASYNNHWGVPLSLARMPATARFGVFEIGMNHAGEITPLVAMVKPHIAIVTNVAPVHLEHFGSVAEIAQAKAEVFSGLMKGGVALINRDIAEFPILERAAQSSPAGYVVTFGESEQADARLLDVALEGAGARVRAAIFGREIAFRLGAPGRHLAMNALAVLVAAKASGVVLEEAAEALGDFSAPAGRGARHALHADDGAFTLIDESYNANPASMRAALALAGAATVGANGRRIAALGDMLELGATSAQLHAALAEAVIANEIDLVFAAGPMMKNLFDALPEARRGAWRASAAELHADVIDALRAGDVIVVKGSNGSRMGPLVAALKKRFASASEAALETA